MKVQYSKHHTPAHGKGTSNSRNLQVFRKINHEISEKFKQNGLILDDFCKDDAEVKFHAHTSGRSAVCPCCGARSGSVKAYRQRTFQDVEFLSMHATIYVETRLFRCKNPECEKKSFAEPLKIAAPYARLTREAEERVGHASLNQAGRLASLSLALQRILVSKHTCIRRASRLGEKNPEFPCSGYVAIDDWAFRKGHSYMCSIVDHKMGIILAVFDGRYPIQVLEWFRAHPEVKLVTRDGSRDYASLIRAGRPEAIQVTDRFHLTKNLTDTMVDALRRMLGQVDRKLKFIYPTEEEALRLIKEDIAGMGDERQRTKVALYFRIHQMQEEGRSLAEISKTVGKKSQNVHRIGQTHISKVLSAEQHKALRHSRDMAAMIAAGTIDAKAVARRMKGRLESRIVCRCMRRIREKYTELRRQVREHNKQLEKTGKCIKVSKDAVRKYINTGNTTNEKLLALPTTHPEISKVINSCIAFRNMIMGKEGSMKLDDWIEEAKTCKCDELYGFASYIESDKEAVRQACETDFSNGIMEGTVNKIKAIKRSMFNRAGVKLLRAKLVYADYGKTPPTCH